MHLDVLYALFRKLKVIQTVDSMEACSIQLLSIDFLEALCTCIREQFLLMYVTLAIVVKSLP